VNLLWGALDTYGVGAITRRQCKESIKKVYSFVGLGSLFNELLFNKLFDLVDLDEDGSLDKKELVDLVMMALTGKTPSKEEVKKEKVKIEKKN